MATIFMKWLETSPKDYERGIEMITFGRMQRIRERIITEFIQPDLKVLDLGCGTGELTRMMAARDSQVSAVDADPLMLIEAGKKVKQQNLDTHVKFHHLDAAMIDDVFPAGSFDLIVCSLVFSSLQVEVQQYLLQSFPGLLAPGGKVVIADETTPKNVFKRALYRIIRSIMLVLTWLLTRNIFSQPLENTQTLFAECGYDTQITSSWWLGSLVLFEAVPQGEIPSRDKFIGQLKHQPSIKTMLKNLAELFFRILPPYPKTRPGLYAVGEPDEYSPVLVTGSYDLTVRRLVRAIDKRVNAWVLVVDTAGINVWCAAGAGFFSAEKVIAALKTSRLAKIVSHKALILPQLAAGGVDGWKIREATGWEVNWGPVHAENISEYLTADQTKNEEMSRVRFPLLNRLEMLVTVLSFYGLMILLPVLIFWRGIFWPVTVAMVCMGLFYAVFLPYIPGRDGLQKAIPFTGLVLVGFYVFTLLGPQMEIETAFKWGLGLIGLAVFTTAELQGTSPMMRGEQANWIAEGIIGAVLVLAYFLVPNILGWS
jgi:ubiquinone/menaquinone biosynthesis C-methylase UbiE